MNAWPLRLELWFASLGRWPLLLVAIAALAAAVWGGLLPLTARQVAVEQQQLEALRSAISTTPVPEAAPELRPDALAAFESRLASDADITRLMNQLWKHGGAAGLQMNKIDYRSEADLGGQFTRLQITLPMTGPYPAVRKFTFSLMAEFPGLSLDKLDMKREQPASGLVETTFHLTLLTRP